MKFIRALCRLFCRHLFRRHVQLFIFIDKLPERLREWCLQGKFLRYCYMQFCIKNMPRRLHDELHPDLRQDGAKLHGLRAELCRA